MTVRRSLERDELERLYVAEGLTIDALAARFACGATTIRRRLAECGIATRARGPHHTTKTGFADRAWSPALAYAVGLIVTDGNLSKDGRHLTLTSADRDLLETFCACLGLANRIAPQRGGARAYYRVQWSDRALFDWLCGIGVTPAKSLCLGALAIPDACFADFVRGCLDGDGTIQIYTDRSGVGKNPAYVYTRLSVRFTSVSFPFLEWIHANLVRLLGVAGGVYAAKARANRAPCWNLKFAQRDSLRLFAWMYYASDLPCLLRKRAQAEQFTRSAAFTNLT